MNPEIVKRLKHNYSEILSRCNQAAERSGRKPQSIKLISVSKTQTPEVIATAIEAGINVFGENYAQELQTKYKYLESSGIIQPEWHFIGHLQTNKIKYIASFVNVIQSIDSMRLAQAVSEHASKAGKEIDVLLQVNTSGELSKSGCEPAKAVDLAAAVAELPSLKLKGLMSIGSFSEDERVYRNEFSLLRKIKDIIQAELGLQLNELSMGMSHDFEAAIEEGATIVRVGTAIFGARSYS